MVARVPHDESLSRGIPAGLKAAKDAAVTEIEDLRRPTSGDELHAERIFDFTRRA